MFAEKMSQFYGPYYNTILVIKCVNYGSQWYQSVLNGDEEPKAALDKFVEQANKTIEEAQ